MKYPTFSINLLMTVASSIFGILAGYLIWTSPAPVVIKACLVGLFIVVSVIFNLIIWSD